MSAPMSDPMKARKRGFDLSTRRRELLEKLLAEEGVEVVRAERIPRRPEDGPAPLSFAQQRLWFLHHLVPGLVAYNLAEALRLRGALDRGALARSLATVFARHEILRTGFAEVEGRAAQVAAPRLELALPVVDLSGPSEAARESEVRRLARALAHRPFDLSRPPLAAITLVRLGAREHALILILHHIVADGWSMGVLVHEVTALYRAFVLGEPAPLPELPIQYADFAHWQRQRLRDELLREQLDFWTGRLAGAPAVLELPTDRPRPPLQSFRGAGLGLALSEPVSRAVKETARRRGATPFMLLLAAWGALLQRYTGQDDLLVGAPIANRNRSETEGLIGFFVNTLVLRVDLRGAPGFGEVVARVADAVLAADRHQDLPIERLLDALKLDRDLSRNPLFQVMFAFHNYPVAPVAMPDLELSPLGVRPATAPFDLNLNLGEGERGLAGVIEYGTDLFDAATVERLAGHFAALLAAALARPDAPLGSLDPAGEAERHQVLAEWNDTAAAEPAELLIHRLFALQAARTPEAVAVVAHGETWTYAELARRAGRIAGHLRALGIGPGDMVGVFVRRSAAMVAALLGILETGAAYVPLEASSPRARLVWILNALSVRCLITDPSRRPALDGAWDELPGLAHVLSLDSIDSLAPGAAPPRPAPAAGADDLAYVIFTSGSTGTPKGVMVRHRPVSNLIHWVNRTFGVGPADRVLFITSLSFDLSVYDVFGLLAAGGSIRVASDDEVRDPALLLAALRNEAVTFWDSAPAALQQLAPLFAGAPAAVSRLRLVFLSGDWVPLALPGQVRTEFPGARVVALGGATEATVWSNFHEIGEIAPHWTSIPYGRPISNARYHVLTRELQPAPIGVPGDLYIGGGCLAAGYAAEPELTARKLLPDPFGAEPGARLYATGDRARYFPDGRLEFLGRLDQQVKVRGYRIELGEIEAALAEHPGVREAVAAVRGDRFDRRLVAYVIPRGEEAPGAEELRAFLGRRLPAYMVPAWFVPLAALPVTGNGKLDRKALPDPEQEPGARGEAAEAPRTPAEEQLTAIWREVLGRERVGIHDNFFEIGGDSILSVQITARAQQAGLRLQPRQIFEHQTIAELALAVGTAPAAEQEQGPVTGPVPLVPIARWLLEQGGADLHHFNQAVLLESREPLADGLLARTLALLAEHHDALRLRLARDPSGEWRQEIAPPGEAVPPVALLDLSGIEESGQQAALDEAAARLHTGFDLERGPLLAAALFRRGPAGGDRLLLVAHHLVIDGVSWRILLDDLETAYRQLARGEEARLPAKTTSYQRWAGRLAERAGADSVRQELAYWLAPARSRVPRLPVDLRAPAEANTFASAGSVSRELGPEATRDLLELVPQAGGASFQEALLAALARALARWTGSGLALVDLEGHGREEIFDDVDLSRTVGWFTVLYPLLLELPVDASAAAALAAVREQLRRVPGRGLGHGLLRYGDPRSEPTERLRALPASQVSFNYLGQIDRALSPGSLFLPAEGSRGPAVSTRRVRPHLLELLTVVVEGRLRATFTYSAAVHLRATVEALADGFTAALGEILEHCRSAPAAAPPDHGLLQADLDAIGLDGIDLDEVLGDVSAEL